MCKVRKNDVKVMKKHDNKVIGVGVELTRMTALSGTIVYGVVVRNLNTGRRYRLYTYDRISRAWNKYKAAVA